MKNSQGKYLWLHRDGSLYEALRRPARALGTTFGTNSGFSWLIVWAVQLLADRPSRTGPYSGVAGIQSCVYA